MSYNYLRYSCSLCGRHDFRSLHGLTQHKNALHRSFEDMDSEPEDSDLESNDDQNGDDANVCSHEDHGGSDNHGAGPSYDDYGGNYSTNNGSDDATITTAVERDNDDEYYYYTQRELGAEEGSDQHEAALEGNRSDYTHEHVYHPTLNGV